MKHSLSPGVSKVKRVVIDREGTIGFMGEEGRVYATPELGRDIEHACRDIVLEYADPGEDSVGVEITVRHTAPTLPGMAVDITATVTAVEGRKVTFEAVAKDELESIGGGTHTRFVVDVAKTYERLKAKAIKLAAARAG
jgi:fluoroacetyl-CoA thioesterase